MPAAGRGDRWRALRGRGLAGGRRCCLAAPAVTDDACCARSAGVCMFVGLASAWNIIGGFAGYASFGNVVFFGLGGYTVAVLMAKARWDFWMRCRWRWPSAAAFAALVGIPVLRLRGHYFAIATLGVAEGMREVVINLPGPDGRRRGHHPPRPRRRRPSPPSRQHRLLLPVPGGDGRGGGRGLRRGRAAASATALRAIARRRAGGRGHRDQHHPGQGGRLRRSRVRSPSLAGALFAFQQVTIYPERLFSVEITVLMVVMAVIGGAGTVVGPVIGAVALQLPGRVPAPATTSACT